MKTRGTIIMIIAAALALGIADSAFSQESRERTTVVPDRFLRGYDPITVFFDIPGGPAGGGPANGPSDALAVFPEIAGEYRWIDAKTIQFLPAVPWPPLREFTVRTRGREASLSSLVLPPSSILPPSGGSGLEPISNFVLVFPAAIETASLAKVISIEVRELPGVSEAGSYSLSSSDFSLVELEKDKSPSSVSYRISLAKPIPYGKKAILSVKLSLDPSMPDSVVKYGFETKPEFRLLAMGSGSVRLPVSSGGALYSDDQAIDCGTGSDPVFLDFSEDIAPPSIELVKRLVRFQPGVKDLSVSVGGSRLLLRFSAERQKLYRISLSRQALTSASGRELGKFGDSGFSFYYRQTDPFITWKAAQGIVERYGPKNFPMEGRGTGRIDLRVHRIDPLNLNFWPFSQAPVLIDENSRPPMPGEEPEAGTEQAKQIRLLGSPEISKIVDLPIGETSGRTKFGLNLAPLLASKYGTDRPGTYLVGYRPIDKTNSRYWVRLTVTDLCLSVVEEEDAMGFLVTSLKTGAPVPGARVRVESLAKKEIISLFAGTTDKTGLYRYIHTKYLAAEVFRIVVTKDDDMLVVDPRSPPPVFQNNHWSSGGGSWLAWLRTDPKQAKHEARSKGFLLTERPVYRPEESVHIVAWLRDRKEGKIKSYSGEETEIVIIGPGEKEWRYKASPNEYGRFYQEFKEAELPTGEYAVFLRQKNGTVLAQTAFSMLSYRVPLFEVNISGPDKVPLDKSFDLILMASYYAGGRLSGEELLWEIEQYPYSISNGNYPGYIFSTEERFSTGEPFTTLGSGSMEENLGIDGSATLKVDPSIEKDGRARRYVVTGTVKGADRQTVSATRQVLALPPFSIGLKLDRIYDKPGEIKAGLIVLDHEEKVLPDRPLTARLYQRQWHSYISETDFTTGEAKYLSDQVDVPLMEKELVSGKEALAFPFSVEAAGVYLLEVFSRDDLGRLVKVKVDFFVSGETPVNWEKKRASVFEMNPDKSSYAPGETAKVLLKSPYIEGYALIVAEAPDANQYSWIPIKNGQGVYELVIRADMTPSVPINALLMRGRVPGTEEASGKVDLGKPASLGASVSLKVRPTENQAFVILKHETKAAPGTDFKVEIEVKDEKGNPLSGEAALWLVDKAVLSLGKERGIDPLPSFIDPAKSFLRISDTRNLTVGNLPPDESPGGDGAEDMMMAEMFNKSTVRKNFKTVPFFSAGIVVKNGKAIVDIALPDNLTDFAIRAVAVCGLDRFGTARSLLSVRLPIVAQPILPRFLRPGDSFKAGAIARVVEGPGGKAQAAVKLTGLLLEETGKSEELRSVVLDEKKAENLFFPIRAPLGMKEGPAEASVSVAIKRSSDQAQDAFLIELPVRPDNEPRIFVKEFELSSAEAQQLPVPPSSFRKDSVARTLVVARDPRFVSVIQGLAYLDRYPHGCIEQMTSILYPSVVLRDLLKAIGVEAPKLQGIQGIKEYFAALASSQNDSGFFSYWPGSSWAVHLTAYVVEFLVQCERSGIPFDRQMLERATDGLRAALRSDSGLTISGYADYEKVEALAALAGAGIYEKGYANDLLVQSPSMELYTQARLLIALKAMDLHTQKTAVDLQKRLSASLVSKREQGREILAGLKPKGGSWGGPVLSSETRALGAISEALLAVDPKNDKLPLLLDAILSKAGGGYWINTIDTIAALRALRSWLDPAKNGDPIVVEVTSGGKTSAFSTGGAAVSSFKLQADSGSFAVKKGADKKSAVYVSVLSEYRPNERGNFAKASSEGFALTREHLLLLGDGGLAAPKKANMGQPLAYALDSIVEEHVRLVNPEARNYVAVSIPIAAGFEPLNPQLANAPKEASPSGSLTRKPSYSIYGDDKVVYYYDSLPAGNYDFYFRVKASFEGSFAEPPAKAELMYDLSARGNSDGVEVLVKPSPKE